MYTQWPKLADVSRAWKSGVNKSMCCTQNQNGLLAIPRPVIREVNPYPLQEK